MPVLHMAVEVRFRDYFDKFGFNDGDGPEGQVGYDYRDRAIRCLNQALKKAGLPVEARYMDVMSMHNNCRIELVRTDTKDQEGRPVEIEVFESEPWEFGGEDDDTFTQHLVKALESAEKAFDKSFKGRRS